MAEGFLGRWSRRKLDVQEGREVEAQAPAEPMVQAPAPQRPAEPPAAPAEPPPTLEDTHLLTPASDFSRFVRPDVEPAVRNAALKKLFTDPHFNVQDGLDVYIGDYTQPDPIPSAMLRSLESVRSLGLFRDEAQEAASPVQPGASPEPVPPQSVAQSDGDAHPDLRLQQDDAPAGDDPGPGPG